MNTMDRLIKHTSQNPIRIATCNVHGAGHISVRISLSAVPALSCSEYSDKISIRTYIFHGEQAVLLALGSLLDSHRKIVSIEHDLGCLCVPCIQYKGEEQKLKHNACTAAEPQRRVHLRRSDMTLDCTGSCEKSRLFAFTWL